MTTTDLSTARVHTCRLEHVLLIRMDRPAKKNAVDASMTTELDAALNLLEDDPDLRCGVLSGGPDHFSAGTDLASGPGQPTARGGGYGVVGRRRRKPLIAAVEGFALGGGFEMALACDLIVSGRTAQFGLPEVTHGVVANCGALFRAHRGVPLNIARQLLLTGQSISADRALQYGLVNETVDDGDAERAALAMADCIAGNAPLAVQASLQACDAYVHRSDALGWELTAVADAEVRASRDLQEGVRAFLEKRRPRWFGQ
ncbi:enoyl-CoA hydratase-related protein [Gordonia hydrophobica]|uniref:Enoyl-CoA hydratase-related protein n=1 Tax=Gordonia hydrophobica TaxID=40516 RepID=A0ABZ2U297_9ACTN|nr:enoyl-CoA hydratase-related protein [Gordonia hydrophobica]MBM7366888.1 enoyl-CoA hydratase/carnithine racemase [Gordonia hydrophobica]